MRPFRGRLGPLELCQRLVERGHEVSVVTLRTYGNSFRDQINNVQVYRSSSMLLTFSTFRYNVPLGFTKLLAKVIREFRPDIANFHTYEYLTSLPLLFVKREFATPCILTADVFAGMWKNATLGNSFLDFATRTYSLSIGRAILAFSDRVIVTFPSHALNAMILGVRKEKIAIIPWGIDLNMFKPMPDQRLKTRMMLGVEEKETVVMFVGRFTFGKGLAPLLEAFSELDHHDVVLVLVGDGPLRKSLEKSVSKSINRVIFTGWQNNIPELLSAADIFVLPSLSEAGGFAAVEACACGVPVIASKVGGVKDYIKDMHTGLSVLPGNRKQLREAIKLLVENPDLRRRLSRDARKVVPPNHNWDDIVKKYEKIYEEQIYS